MADVTDDEGQSLEGESATQAFLSGAATVAPDADGRVRVVDRLGRFGSVAAEDLESFLVEEQGSRLATAGEVNERRLQQQYGEGIATEVRTAAEEALRTATLGGSDVLIGELGGEEAREGLRERRERNPLSRATGTGLGVAATMLATGGSGGLARTLAATPGGIAARAGLAAERALAGSSVASRVGATAAAGTLEGAIFGAGEGVSQWALDPDAQERTAERLIASMGEYAGPGAVLGGLAAGGVAGAGAALGAGARKVKQSLAGVFRGRAADVAEEAGALVPAAARGTDDVGEALARGPAARGEAPGSMAPPGKQSPLERLAEGATARRRFSDRQQLATREITELASDNARVADDMIAHTNVGLKRHPVKRALQETPVASMDATAADVLDQLQGFRGKLEQRMQSVGEFRDGGQRAFKKLYNEAFGTAENAGLDGIEERIRSALFRGDEEGLADAYIEMDKLKRRVGRIQGTAARGIDGDETAQALLRQDYEELRGFLENADVWGSGLSTLQRDVNRAWSQYLDYARAYESRFALSGEGRTTRSARDGFEAIADADGNKVGAFLNQAGKAESEQAEAVLKNATQLQADLLDTLQRYYNVPELGKGAIGRARKNAAKISEHVDELKRLRTVGDQFDETAQALADIPAIGGQLAKLQVSAGRMIDTATNRLGSLQRMYAASENVGSKITEGVKAFAEKTRSAGRALPRRAAEGAATAASRRQEFERVYTTVRDFEKDPQAAVRRAMRTQGQLSSNAPHLARAYAQKTVTAAAFLASKMPRPQPSSAMFDRVDQDKAPRVSDVEMREFLDYARAVEQPLSVVQDLQRGHVSPRAVEAVRTVYPQLYAQIQDEVIAQFEDGDPPSYDARLELGMLFQLPTDAALSPSMLALLQQSAATMPAVPQNSPDGGMLAPSSRSAPELAGITETKSQAISGAR